jgi:hypothetical protein
MNLGAYGEGKRGVDLARRHNPVLFWNDTSLQLVALDHSIDAKDARAPGPCASARALGLAHIVMADAVAAAYPVDFEGLYVRSRAPIRGFPDVFVGGAVAWILEFIFGTPAHSQLIGSQRLRFLCATLRRCASWGHCGASGQRPRRFSLVSFGPTMGRG